MLPLIAAIWLIFDTMCHYVCHHQTKRAQKCLRERERHDRWSALTDMEDMMTSFDCKTLLDGRNNLCHLISSEMYIKCAWSYLFLHYLHFVLKHSVEMFTTEFEFKLYQISSLQRCVALPDFLAPLYPTQTNLQYSAHATLLHHTLAWLY